MAICPSKQAYRTELNLTKKILKRIGGTDIKFKSAYYEFSGFATLNGQILYFSCNDARSWDFEKRLLIRKASSYKDYSGEINNFCPIEENEIIKLSESLSH